MRDHCDLRGILTSAKICCNLMLGRSEGQARIRRCVIVFVRVPTLLFFVLSRKKRSLRGDGPRQRCLHFTVIVFPFYFNTAARTNARPPPTHPALLSVMHAKNKKRSCTLQVAAGSVVLRDLPAHATAAGVPAKILGVATEGRPSEVVDQNLKHVRYLKNPNGNGHGLNDKYPSLLPTRGDSGADGAPRDASAAARRRSVGVRTIERMVKSRSFL